MTRIVVMMDCEVGYGENVILVRSEDTVARAGGWRAGGRQLVEECRRRVPRTGAGLDCIMPNDRKDSRLLRFRR